MRPTERLRERGCEVARREGAPNFPSTLCPGMAYGIASYKLDLLKPMPVSCSNVLGPHRKLVWCGGSDGPKQESHMGHGDSVPRQCCESSAHRGVVHWAAFTECARCLFQSLIVSLLLWTVSQVAIREGSVRAQAPLSEYRDKATSVAVLAGYVKWPAATRAPLTVGILGVDPFGGALEAMATKRSDRIEDLKDCQIIFVARSEHQKIDAILESLGDAHILTIGECEDFAKRGGMIGFVIEDGRVRFEVNTAAARRAGLGIDLRLLKLAVRVHNL